jgi:Gas vesicle protein K
MTANRLVIDDDTIERDLVQLVLTVVELLRQLMERQALRRVDKGDLTEDQEERIGRTLMLLEDRMARLRERYRLSDQDLNLDLVPSAPCSRDDPWAQPQPHAPGGGPTRPTRDA